MGKSTQLAISNMHCTSCAAVIERELKKVPGVSDATVNFANKKAVIKLDSEQAMTEQLVHAVHRAGYKAEPMGDNDHGMHDHMHHDEANTWRRKFLVGLGLSVPMFYFMLLDFVPALPSSEFVMSAVGVVSLVLASVAQFYLGAGFYRGT